jgi:hypothetical protein
VRVPLTAGPHAVGVAFLEKTHARNSRRLQSYTQLRGHHRFLGLSAHRQFFMTGHSPTGVSDTPSRRRLFVCGRRIRRKRRARQVLSTVARRAYAAR